MSEATKPRFNVGDEVECRQAGWSDPHGDKWVRGTVEVVAITRDGVHYSVMVHGRGKVYVWNDDIRSAPKPTPPPIIKTDDTVDVLFNGDLMRTRITFVFADGTDGRFVEIRGIVEVTKEVNDE